MSRVVILGAGIAAMCDAEHIRPGRHEGLQRSETDLVAAGLPAHAQLNRGRAVGGRLRTKGHAKHGLPRVQPYSGRPDLVVLFLGHGVGFHLAGQAEP